jgi:hypothetical protein
MLITLYPLLVVIFEEISNGYELFLTLLSIISILSGLYDNMLTLLTLQYGPSMDRDVSVMDLIAEKSIAAVVSQKKTAVKHDKYKRVDQFAIGKRRVTLLQPIGI